jgi:hypothetical protein
MNKNQDNDPTDLFELIEKYEQEYKRDSTINELQIDTESLRISTLKGKWTGYKVYNQARILYLEREKERIIEDGIEIVMTKHKESGNPITKNGAEVILKKSNHYKSLDTRIKNLKILCELFEANEKNIASISFDIKNYLAAKQLEES